MDELAQLQSGGEEVLVALLRKHHDRLVKMVHVRVDPRLGRRLDHDDVLQDAFVILSRRLADFVANPHVPVFVWMRAAVDQALIDAHRKHLGARMRDVRLEAVGRLPPNSEVFIEQLAGNLTSPSQKFARREQEQQLTQAFERLSALDHEVLSLRHFEELTNGEVAAVLGLSAAAASHRYLRALTRLRRLLLLQCRGHEGGLDDSDA